MWRPVSPRTGGITSAWPMSDVVSKILEKVVGYGTSLHRPDNRLVDWIVFAYSSLTRYHQKSTGEIMMELAPKYELKEVLLKTNVTIESLNTLYFLDLWMKIQCNKWKSSAKQELSLRSMPWGKKKKLFSDSIFDLRFVTWVVFNDYWSLNEQFYSIMFSNSESYMLEFQYFILQVAYHIT